jgi:dimethylhistidine N-methyltransferase
MNALVDSFTAHASSSTLLDRFHAVRRRTLSLTASLGPEDMVVQSMPDASPTKWHLAHTTWFFETFVIAPSTGDYRVFDEDFGFCFNSYYEAVGSRHPRSMRGLLTRPALARVLAYRKHVDARMDEILRLGLDTERTALVELGIAHEEQHQELLVMDALHLFSESPLKPAFDPAFRQPAACGRASFLRVDGGLATLGTSERAFAFDNERPAHVVWLEPFEIADRLVTNEEWLAFIDAGGYEGPSWWLSDGWDRCREERWIAPLYWKREGDRWFEMTPRGLVPLDRRAAVRHVSYYEADAYARWRGARLPTEMEWEHAVSSRAARLHQVSDTAWQWTSSAYAPYPGFAAVEGAVGEYNGKFMSGQMVLRGGASITPPGHERPTYRNFYRAHQRWMFSGVRLARTVDDRDPKRAFLRDALAGLAASPRRLAPKYFYDDAGSALFEAITEAPEYYPTRTETALLDAASDELASLLERFEVLVELGSGASRKTGVLLDAVPTFDTYVPIDISGDALDGAAARLRAARPALAVLPIESDFTRSIDLPGELAGRPTVAFFPGSTIGNFDAADAVALMDAVRRALGPRAKFLVGVDLVKPEATLRAAYDDGGGITAAFNRNVLARMNRELGSDFDLDAFAHRAVWNAEKSRMEMHLVSSKAQTVRLGCRSFAFEAGESIHTENSYKFTLASFRELAERGGWRVEHTWTAKEHAFALFLLEPLVD